MSVSPQQIQALRQQQQQQMAASGSSGPPPLLLGPRTSIPAGQGQRGMVQPGLIRIGSSANTLVSISQVLSSTENNKTDKERGNMHKCVLSPRMEEILTCPAQVEVFLNVISFHNQGYVRHG